MVKNSGETIDTSPAQSRNEPPVQNQDEPSAQNQEKWYVVSAGIYQNKSDAKSALPAVKKVYSGAYVKYSGEWQG